MGLLCLQTGSGKTVIALSILAELSQRSCIMVHKSQLLQQWKSEINRFLPNVRVGIVQQTKRNFFHRLRRLYRHDTDVAEYRCPACNIRIHNRRRNSPFAFHDVFEDFVQSQRKVSLGIECHSAKKGRFDTRHTLAYRRHHIRGTNRSQRSTDDLGSRLSIIGASGFDISRRSAAIVRLRDHADRRTSSSKSVCVADYRSDGRRGFRQQETNDRFHRKASTRGLFVYDVGRWWIEVADWRSAA